MLTNLGRGLEALGNFQAIAYLVAGSIIGMVFGAIPGLGGAVILSIVLAFIYHISITGTLCLFLATQAGSYFSASVSSILLNTPAHPEAFAVTLDGFPMARRGEAGRALGLSAMSTCVGGIIGCILLVAFYQVINVLPEVFHPPEYVSLILIAMILVGTLGTNVVSKALISIGLGLVVASVGTTISGAPRYTFSTVGLQGGLSLVAVALGCFALPQLILIFGTGTAVARQDMLGRVVTVTKPIDVDKSLYKQVLQGLAEPWHHKFIMFRAAVVGTLTGVVPGIGGFAANFLSYGIAQQNKKKRHLYGTGIAEGVIAAEGSSLAKEAGGMIPMFGLGIPGGVGNALFLSALAIKDFMVGFGFVGQNPTISYEVVWIILFGGIIGTASGVILAPVLARITKVPGPALLPLILSISIVGTFVATTNYFDVMEMLVFCCIGLVLRRLQYSLASFAIGLVLGPTLETNVYQSHAIFPGFTIFTARPLADVLLVIAIGILLLKAKQSRGDSRLAKLALNRENGVALADGSVPALDDSDVSVDLVVDHLPGMTIETKDFPLLELITSLALLALGLFWCIYGAENYDITAALMPCIGAGIVAAASIWRLFRDFPTFRTYARSFRSVHSHHQMGDLQMASTTVSSFGSSSYISAGDLEAADSIVSGRNWSLFGRRTESPEIDDHAWGRNGQYTREVAALCWIGVAMLLCYLFGFSVGIPVLCGLYGLLAMRRIFKTWSGQLLFTVLSATTMWAVAYWIVSVLHIYFVPKINF